MKCAIHQPQFLPWLGYLHKIHSADVFVYLDNVQFKKNEFQNRNKLLINGEPRWLTVPVSFTFGDTLADAKIAAESAWGRKMWQTIEQNYRKAPHFQEYAEGLKNLLDVSGGSLATFNRVTVEWLLRGFGIETRTVVCSELPEFCTDRTRRLVEICRHLGADTYFSGVGARDYLEMREFEAAGIRVEFQEFTHPVYAQAVAAKAGGFVSHLSAVDGLFNCGGGADGRKALNLH